MPYWIALIPPGSTAASEGCPAGSQQHGVGCWALQFTPRVVLLEEAVLMEVEASRRLFGGEEALRERLRAEAAEMGCAAVACAPTSLGALALARAGVQDGFAQPLHRLLNGLPLDTLSIVGANQPVLARLGCRTLGDVRRLPRGGLNRRFVADLLLTLDQAYGDRPDTYDWLQLPEVFEARLELPGRVDTGPAMMVGARRLLIQMTGWLAARHCGVRHFTLAWLHDAMRPRHVQAHGEITIRTAEVTRHLDHLARLLSEHLARITLEAPVGDLFLSAREAEPLEECSANLLPQEGQRREPFHELLERLAARLGADRVRRPVLVSDHRIEWMQWWQPAAQALPRQGPRPAENLPQPTWILPTPLRLALRGNKPFYQGVLQLLAGPHRVESGWWHRDEIELPVEAPDDAEGEGATPQEQITHDVERDYYVAQSPHAGLLWVYRERMPPGEGEGQWFLHGMFA